MRSYLLLLIILWQCCSPAWAQTSLQQALDRAQPQLGFTRLPPQDAPGLLPDQHYQLGPGDPLSLNLWNSRLNVAYELQVNPQGQVLVPRLGVFQAQNKTLKTLESEIHKQAQLLPGEAIQTQLFLKQVRRVQVLITGYVNRPGYYQVYWSTPLLEALRFAGGLKDNGSLRRISLQKGDTRQAIDLLRFQYQGQQSANPLLFGGEHIHVPVLEQDVAILGEVQQPGIYEIQPGDTIQHLLSWAGGLKPTADPGQLERWPQGLRNSQLQAQKVNLEQLLSAGDIVFSPPRQLEAVSQNLLVQGLVKQTGPLSWRQGMRLLDALEQSGGALPNADLTAVRLSRRQGAQRQEQLINFEAYLKGQNPDGNPELQPDDLISVPEQFWSIRNISELTTLILSTLGIVSVVVNLSGSFSNSP